MHWYDELAYGGYYNRKDTRKQDYNMNISASNNGSGVEEAAKNLGYSKINEQSHSQSVFQNTKRNPTFITPDIDSHNEGIWKGADSVKNLGRKSTRAGTYDANLKRIGD